MTETLEREQVIPMPLEAVWSFFTNPRNLEAITPRWLNFRIVEAPSELGRGSILRYRLRLFGIPIRWRTEIVDWTPPHGFVDVQTSGPFQLWEHTHAFEPVDEHSTRMRDRVRYRVPLAPLALPLVRRWVDSIFDYRAAVLRR